MRLAIWEKGTLKALWARYGYEPFRIKEAFPEPSRAGCQNRRAVPRLEAKGAVEMMDDGLYMITLEGATCAKRMARACVEDGR